MSRSFCPGEGTTRCGSSYCESTEIVWYSCDNGGGLVGTPDYYWCKDHEPKAWAWDFIRKIEEE